MIRKGGWVYVSGPISSDPLMGARLAVQAGERLRRAGLIPIVPHLSVLWQMIEPISYEEWMTLDLALIDRCDALLRLPGKSSGSDREVAHAEQRGIPVYHHEIDLMIAPRAVAI